MRKEGFVSAREDFTLLCGQPLGSRVPEVKPITTSFTSGDDITSVRPLKSSPNGVCVPWAFVGFGADLMPKRGSVAGGGCSIWDFLSIHAHPFQDIRCNYGIHSARARDDAIINLMR